MTAKRITAIFLSLTVCAAMFGGCGSNADSTQNSDSEKSAETTENTETSETKNYLEMTPAEITADMKLGYNLGNSLDVCNADRDGDGSADETAEKVDETLWGNPIVTKEQIQFVKDSGFDSVRIPVTWRDHMDENYTIDSEWLDRVQEVVDYAHDLGMYVIINVHHDGGGDPQFGAWMRGASYDYEGVLKRYKTVWAQICERFKDYDGKLLFESLNEVGFDDLPQDKAYETLNNLNQEFVDLVRESGGNNDKRHLVIAGYWTDVAMTCNEKYTMPQDPAEHSILSVHYYTPWEFCTTTNQHEWGSDAEVELMKSKVTQMKEYWVDKGTPVLIGEYGTCKGNDENSRVEFCKDFVELCTQAGIPTYIWDDGSLFERADMKWQNEEMIEAIRTAANL